ncbi:hypothetical protein Tco_0500945 [Tanacetum coccineum]
MTTKTTTTCTRTRPVIRIPNLTVNNSTNSLPETPQGLRTASASYETLVKEDSYGILPDHKASINEQTNRDPVRVCSYKKPIGSKNPCKTGGLGARKLSTKAFTEVFKKCDLESLMKLVCLSAIKEMLFHKESWLSTNTSNSGIVDFQSTQIREIPLFLTALADRCPTSSEAVLHLHIHLGQCPKKCVDWPSKGCGYMIMNSPDEVVIALSGLWLKFGKLKLKNLICNQCCWDDRFTSGLRWDGDACGNIGRKRGPVEAEAQREWTECAVLTMEGTKSDVKWRRLDER